MFLSWRILPRTAGEQAYTVAQAFAIVENRPVSARAGGRGRHRHLPGPRRVDRPRLFGMTIVVKRASQPYVVTSPDDDV